jgi:predicted metalloprotease
MRMDGQEESSNVEDARGSSGRGGGGGFGIGGRGIGLGTVAIALVAGWVFGINPLTVLGLLSGGGAPIQHSAPGPVTRPPADDPQARFVSQVLRSTEVVWGQIFSEAGKTYQVPKLTLYTGRYPTGCGEGDAAMGPFYCPADAHVYLDMGFFQTMRPVRAGLRHRARGRTPCPEPAGHQRQGRCGAPARHRSAGQCHERAA